MSKARTSKAEADLNTAFNNLKQVAGGVPGGAMWSDGLPNEAPLDAILELRNKMSSSMKWKELLTLCDNLKDAISEFILAKKSGG